MGRIIIEKPVHSLAEGFPRQLRVFLPTQYDAQPQTHFGLIVMHDGQNVFEHPESACRPTWAADLAVQSLMDDGRIGPWLVVAVDHGQGRFEDYSPWNEPRASVVARAPQYARFLREQLLPWACARFRLREGPEWTATVGSSLGGLFSLYLGLDHFDVFGRIMALSPSVMWGDDGLFRHWKTHTRHFTKLYLDAGTNEVMEAPGFSMQYGERVRAFHQQLLSLGYAPHEVRCTSDEGGSHGETDWRRRLPSALEWALGS